MLFRNLFIMFFISTIPLSFSETLYPEKEEILPIKDRDKYNYLKVERTFSENDICIDCESKIDLAKSVNNIIDKMKLGGSKVDISDISDVANHIGELKVSIALAEEANKNFRNLRVDCNFLDNYMLVDVVSNYETNNGILLFDKVIPIDNIDTIVKKNKRQSTYFYRGKGIDKDKVVIIRFLANSKLSISYYKVQILPQSDLPTLGGFNAPEKDEVGLFSRLRTSKSGDKIDLGLKIDMIKGDVSKISVVDIEKRILGSKNTTNIKSTSEISNEKQTFGLAIESPEGTSRISAEASIDGNVGIELNQGISVMDEGFKVRGSVNSENNIYTSSVELLNSSDEILFKVARNRDDELSFKLPVNLYIESSNLSINGDIEYSKDGLRSKYSINNGKSNIFDASVIRRNVDHYEIEVSKSIIIDKSSDLLFHVSSKKSKSGVHDFVDENRVWISYRKKL